MAKATITILSLLVGVIALTAGVSADCTGKLVSTNCQCVPRPKPGKHCEKGLVCLKVTLRDLINANVCVLPGLCANKSALGLGCNCLPGQTCGKNKNCYVPAIGGLLGLPPPPLNGVCCNPALTKNIPFGCPCAKGSCLPGLTCTNKFKYNLLTLTLLGGAVCIAL